MPGWQRLKLLVPESFRRLPADLAAVVLITTLTGAAILLPVVQETPIRTVLAFPFLLFAPGYAFVAALFPEAAPDEHEPITTPRRHLDGVERFVLALATSVAIVILTGVALNFTPWGIRPVPLWIALTLFTFAAVGAAAKRRRRLPAERRFSIPADWYPVPPRLERVFKSETRHDKLLNVALAVAIVVAASSVGFALVDQPSGDAYTALYLLTRDDAGELIADQYPTNLTTGTSEPLIVGVRNHEYERSHYTVIMKLQRVAIVGSDQETGAVTVQEEERLDGASMVLGHNETWRGTMSITPSLTGDRLRLVVLLYRGAAPADPTVENAYREAHLWVNVTSTGVSGSPPS